MTKMINDYLNMMMFEWVYYERALVSSVASSLLHRDTLGRPDIPFGLGERPFRRLVGRSAGERPARRAAMEKFDKRGRAKCVQKSIRPFGGRSKLIALPLELISSCRIQF